MRKVRLDEVVRRANTKEDKDNTEKEYYIGGEHIDSNEVLITKRGVIAGSTIGPMFYFGFTSGQVLLVSRNPHLRKAGMVTFDGICSEKTFVLESIDESILLQQYLPFVLQSDHFWSYAESNKSGSVNYFLNWSTLAKYEFELPSIAEQKELSDLLWSINDTKLAYRNMIQKTDELVKSQFIEKFGNPLNNDKGWPTKRMSEVAPSIPYKGEIESEGGKYWMLNLDMVESNTGRILEKVMVSFDEIGTSTTTFSEEYVLYSKLRPYLNKVVIPGGSGYATTELIPLKPDQSIIIPTYLASLLRGDEFLSFIENQVSGTKMPRVTMKVFWDFEVILPPLKLQYEFEEFVSQSNNSKLELQQSLETTETLYRSILAENFG